MNVYCQISYEFKKLFVGLCSPPNIPNRQRIRELADFVPSKIVDQVDPLITDHSISWLMCFENQKLLISRLIDFN